VATNGAWKTSYTAGGQYGFDVFVAKFNSTGTTLLWGTYYGGAEDDYGYDIALDASNNVYITGTTSSTSGIATSRVWQNSYGGNGDAFIAKFNSSGSVLLWGTYYGGSADDGSLSIALDGNDNPCITGFTFSTNGIATSGAWQSSTSGSYEIGFVAKFNSSGTNLSWGTYTGSIGSGNSLVLDGSDNVIITGGTYQAGIATAGAWQTTYGGNTDAFVAKFNPTGTALIWETYYGGSQRDVGEALVLDRNDNIYVYGTTSSSNNIATPGSWQTSYGGNADIFVAKFNSTGTNLDWGTYYGGSGAESVSLFVIGGSRNIALDGSNNVYITGNTESTNGIATAGSWQSVFGGNFDALAAKFNSTGTNLLWGTYYGCYSSGEEGSGIVVDANGNAYITGSADFDAFNNCPLVTSCSWQTAFGNLSASNSFISKFADHCTITVSITKTDAGCGQNNGTATANPNGSCPYTYTWSTGAGTQTISSLPSGVYTVTVTDQIGCSSTASTTIGHLISGTATVSVLSEVSCMAGLNGKVTASVSGGTSPYSYSWTGGANSQTVAGLAAGSYSLTVTDQNGCTAFSSATISQPSTPILTTINSTPYNCGSNNGIATVIASGGGGTYQYSWSPGGQTGASITWTGLGNNVATVTDNLGCQVKAILSIVQGTNKQYSYVSLPNPISLNADSSYYVVSDEVNCGDQWYDNNTTLTPGSIASIPTPVFSDITTPQNWGFNGTTNHCYVPVDFQYQTSPVNFITAKILGTLRNNYSGWVGTEVQVGAAALIVTSLGRIFVTGNSHSHVIKLVLASTGQDVPGGAVTFTPAGGVNGQFSYVSLQIPILLNPNTLYYLVSQEVNGGDQWYDNNTSVTPGPAGTIPTPIFSSANSPQNWAFNGSANHSYVPLDFQYETASSNFITATTPGTLRNNYSGWVGMKLQIGASPQAVSTLGRIYITGNGNSHTIKLVQASTGQDVPGGSVNIMFIGPAFADSISSTSASCGQANGSATVTAGSCNEHFTYLWSTQNTTPTISNVAGGNFTVTVTDGNSCAVTASITVADIAGETATISSVSGISCHGGSSGSVTVSVVGGTSPYTYTWNNGATTQTVSTLVSGTYTVTVRDANACSSISSVILTQPSAVTATMTENNASCGQNNGNITVNAGGGTGVYTYTWSNGPSTMTDLNLAPGSYTVTVKDHNGCSLTSSAPVIDIAGEMATAAVVKDETCHGGSAGITTVSTTGGTLPYTYKWSEGATSSTVNNLTAGTYTVTVKDANGCMSTSSVDITEPSAMSVTVTENNASCGSNNGSATVTAGGGSGAYTYSWSNGPTTTLDSDLSAGSYTITVKDLYGCSFSSEAIINNNGAGIVTIQVIRNENCFGENQGSAVAIMSGGTSPFTYSWSNGATSQTVNGLSADSYNVSITDSKGCENISMASITQPSSLVTNISENNVSCNGAANGSASVSVLYGTAPYTYSWNTIPTQSTDTATNLAGGTYTVEITDKNGCSTFISTVITEPLLLFVSESHKNPTCDSCDNGTAVLLPSGGTAPYTYSWSTTPLQNRDTAIHLSADMRYSWCITDNNGCAICDTITLGISPLGVINLSGKNNSFTLQVFPNPSNGEFVLHAQASEKQDMYIRITNLIGQVLFTDQLLQTTTYNKTINIRNFPDGLYIMNLLTSERTYSQRIVLEK